MLGTINEKALQELGWPRLCAELASRSRTPMGRERAQSLLPHSDPDVARQQLALVEEARLLRQVLPWFSLIARIENRRAVAGMAMGLSLRQLGRACGCSRTTAAVWAQHGFSEILAALTAGR